MTNFLIALHSVITPWTVAVVCLILLGISVYWCAVEKKARDRADREREAAAEAERRAKVLRLQDLADIARQRTRETERRMRAADRDGVACSQHKTERPAPHFEFRITPPPRELHSCDGCGNLIPTDVLNCGGCNEEDQ